jgi:hypothetical protein
MKRLLLILPLIGLLAGCPLNPGRGDLCADAETRCDDENPCTTDSCTDDTGVCMNIVITCPEGQSCDRETGECAAEG